MWPIVRIAFTLLAGDWLNQGMHSQPNERDLNPSNASKIKLLWTRQLSDKPLSAPIIHGRLITYRGTVELVFVASASGQIFALDGDSGKTFWIRNLDSGKKCLTPATPALTPDDPDHDADDDGPQPVRPIYAISPSAYLFGIHPIDGKDLSPPRPFHCAAYLTTDGKQVRSKSKVIRTPIDANGLRITLTNELQIIDATTQKILYTSTNIGIPKSTPAIANGHICFTASGTLACYGIPLEP